MNDPSETRSSRRLEEILRSLPAGELAALVDRLGIEIVAAKRIDASAQVARALVALPEVRDTGRLPPASAELLHRIAENGGSLVVHSIPPGLEALVGRGIVFARVLPVGAAAVRSFELVLPHAQLVQLRTWDGDSPRGLRALLAQLPFETSSAIASHYLGRPATPPIALSLESAWETLCDPERLRAEIDKLAPLERRLLEAIDDQGGEVDTEELLDLEREPMRLRGAGGASMSRRGVGFALERRGLLVPIHPNRHVVPDEVAEVVGAHRRAERAARREQIRGFVLGADHAPRRARFASPPAPLALALALAVREPGVDVRAGIGTPRSLVTRLSQRFGRDADTISLVAALSRAIGLWDPSALYASASPGTLTVTEVGRALYAAWWRGGAWDEARADREVLRASGDARDASPVGVLRELLVDALRELGEGRWVPWNAVASYVRDDPRTPGVERLLRRWAERVGTEPVAPDEVARRIALQTLPSLGVVDVGLAEDDEGGVGTTLRLTQRGRALLAGQATAAAPTASRFVDARLLSVGGSARVASVLALAPLCEVGQAGEELDIVITAPAIARALSAGIEPDVVKARIEAVAPLPEAISSTLAQASVLVGKATLAPASAFLWVDDGNVRELLRTRRTTADLFVDPSPTGGLLVALGVDADKVVRRCRGVGVEVSLESGQLQARAVSGSMPRAGGSVPPAAASSRRSGLARRG